MSDALKQALPLLRRPFTSAAIHFKIQTNPKEKQGGQFGPALVVTYMDSRLAAERLNSVCPGDWSDEYTDRTQNGVVCRLTVFGQTRSDVGFSQDTGSDMGLKGLYSDAYKRAAVKFGIGACFYALPKMYVDAAKLKKGPKSWYMTPAAEAELRQKYEAWLNGPGKQRFGDALDHGDALDAQGDVETHRSEEAASRGTQEPNHDAASPPANGHISQERYTELVKAFVASEKSQDSLKEFFDVKKNSEVPPVMKKLTEAQAEGFEAWLKS